ncbi:MAG: methyl-accepting chemotaxis protein [Desulfobulbaceae bacterium]
MSRGSSGAKTAGGGLGTRVMVSMGTIMVLVTLLAGFCLYAVMSQPPTAVSGRPPVSSANKAEQAGKIAPLSHEARTIEQQFHKEQSPASVVQFEEVSKNLLAQALELEKNAKQGNDPEAAKAGAQVIQLVSQYSTSFRDLVQAWEVKGITEDAGLRQKLSQAALNITSPATAPDKYQGLEAALMQLGRAEQNYFAAPGAENQRLLVNTAAALIAAAEESGLAASEFQAINKNIKDYIAAFDRYQAVSLATSDPALSATFAAEQVKQEEAMRKASLALEKMINGLSTSQATTAVQTIRQQEQEYLTKGDAASAALVGTTMEEYSKALDDAQLPQPQKTAMKKAAAEYQAAFTAIVEQDKKITEQGALVDKAFTALQEKIKEISTNTAPPLPARTTVFTPAPQLSLMIIAGAWLASMLVALLMARILTGSIVTPLRRMTDIARRMTDQDDFSLTFPPEKNEFGDLANTLNALVRQQTANASGSWTTTAEQSAKIGDLARLIRNKAGHDAHVAKVLAEQEQVLVSLRTAVEQMKTAAESLSRNTGGLAERGQDVREAAAGCDQSITAAVGSVQAISQSAGQMATVINTFTDLAEQTSVMALNAAIKATRAGTQGNSFSAVTEDLDRLAKRANETAKELTLLSSSMTSRMAGGDKLGNECLQALHHLVTIGSGEQQAIEAINNSVIDLQTASADTGTLLGELDALSRQAGDLVHEQEPMNKEVLDTLSFLDSASGSSAGADLPLEEEMKNMLHEFQNHETDPEQTSGSPDTDRT